MPQLAETYCGRPTAMKYIKGCLLPCYYMGVWTNNGHWMLSPDKRKYHAWRAIGNRLSSFVRLEPVEGGRARMCYDPGHGIQSKWCEQETSNASQ